MKLSIWKPFTAVPLLNKTSYNEIKLGGIEVQTEELLRVFSEGEFCFFETLYQILIPITSNMIAETTETTRWGDKGWERIRNDTIRRTLEFDSTVKLWDVNRKGHPLFQKLPHSIMHDDKSNQYFMLRRLNIPTDLKEARKEFRNFTRTGEHNIMKAGAENILSSWNHNRLIRSRLLRCLNIASNVVPRMALSSNKFRRLVRHSLKTEFMKDIEMNAHNMGLMNDSEDSKFSHCIRKFQEPSERFVPMDFTTTYKTSLYATLPSMLTPASVLDFELDDGKRKDVAVEINVIVQNLVTAWPRKFDKLHDLTREMPVKDVLPNSIDITKVCVKRSVSDVAKSIGGAATAADMDNRNITQVNWLGRRNFREITAEATGLRPRINATSSEP